MKKDWRSFACFETEKEKIVLGTSGFAKCAGTDAMERKEHFYERRIPETTIYRVVVQGRHPEKWRGSNKGEFRKPQRIYRKSHSLLLRLSLSGKPSRFFIWSDVGIHEGHRKNIRESFGSFAFQIAVEMAKLESMLAAINDMDEATMRRLHIRCVNEVKKINGILTMEDAVRYQRSDE